MTTERLIHELAAKGQPVRRIAHPVISLLRWMLVAVVCLGVGILALGPRPDLEAAFQNPTSLVVGLLTLALGASAAFSAFTMSVPGMDRRWLRAVPAVILSLGIVVLAFSAVAVENPHAGLGIVCVARIFALAALPNALLLTMLRKSAALHAGTAGVFATLSAAALGTFGVQLVCVHDDPLHILVWHFVPMMFLCGAGFLLGRLWFTWDRR